MTWKPFPNIISPRQLARRNNARAVRGVLMGGDLPQLLACVLPFPNISDQNVNQNRKNVAKAFVLWILRDICLYFGGISFCDWNISCFDGLNFERPACSRGRVGLSVDRLPPNRQPRPLGRPGWRARHLFTPSMPGFVANIPRTPEISAFTSRITVTLIIQHALVQVNTFTRKFCIFEHGLCKF